MGDPETPHGMKFNGVYDLISNGPTNGLIIDKPNEISLKPKDSSMQPLSQALLN